MADITPLQTRPSNVTMCTQSVPYGLPPNTVCSANGDTLIIDIQAYGDKGLAYCILSGYYTIAPTQPSSMTPNSGIMTLLKHSMYCRMSPGVGTRGLIDNIQVVTPTGTLVRTLYQNVLLEKNIAREHWERNNCYTDFGNWMTFHEFRGSQQNASTVAQVAEYFCFDLASCLAAMLPMNLTGALRIRITWSQPSSSCRYVRGIRVDLNNPAASGMPPCVPSALNYGGLSLSASTGTSMAAGLSLYDTASTIVDLAGLPAFEPLSSLSFFISNLCIRLGYGDATSKDTVHQMTHEFSYLRFPVNTGDGQMFNLPLQNVTLNLLRLEEASMLAYQNGACDPYQTLCAYTTNSRYNLSQMQPWQRFPTESPYPASQMSPLISDEQRLIALRNKGEIPNYLQRLMGLGLVFYPGEACYMQNQKLEWAIVAGRQFLRKIVMPRQYSGTNDTLKPFNNTQNSWESNAFPLVPMAASLITPNTPRKVYSLWRSTSPISFLLPHRVTACQTIAEPLLLAPSVAAPVVRRGSLYTLQARSPQAFWGNATALASQATTTYSAQFSSISALRNCQGASCILRQDSFSNMLSVNMDGLGSVETFLGKLAAFGGPMPGIWSYYPTYNYDPDQHVHVITLAALRTSTLTATSVTVNPSPESSVDTAAYYRTKFGGQEAATGMTQLHQLQVMVVPPRINGNFAFRFTMLPNTHVVSAFLIVGATPTPSPGSTQPALSSNETMNTTWGPLCSRVLAAANRVGLSASGITGLVASVGITTNEGTIYDTDTRILDTFSMRGRSAAEHYLHYHTTRSGTLYREQPEFWEWQQDLNRSAARDYRLSRDRSLIQFDAKTAPFTLLPCGASQWGAIQSIAWNVWGTDRDVMAPANTNLLHVPLDITSKLMAEVMRHPTIATPMSITVEFDRSNAYLHLASAGGGAFEASAVDPVIEMRLRQMTTLTLTNDGSPVNSTPRLSEGGSAANMFASVVNFGAQLSAMNQLSSLQYETGCLQKTNTAFDTTPDTDDQVNTFKLMRRGFAPAALRYDSPTSYPARLLMRIARVPEQAAFNEAYFKAGIPITIPAVQSFPSYVEVTPRATLPTAGQFTGTISDFVQLDGTPMSLEKYTVLGNAYMCMIQTVAGRYDPASLAEYQEPPILPYYSRGKGGMNYSLGLWSLHLQDAISPSSTCLSSIAPNLTTTGVYYRPSADGVDLRSTMPFMGTVEENRFQYYALTGRQWGCPGRALLDLPQRWCDSLEPTMIHGLFRVSTEPLVAVYPPNHFGYVPDQAALTAAGIVGAQASCAQYVGIEAGMSSYVRFPTCENFTILDLRAYTGHRNVLTLNAMIGTSTLTTRPSDSLFIGFAFSRLQTKNRPSAPDVMTPSFLWDQALVHASCGTYTQLVHFFSHRVLSLSNSGLRLIQAAY